MQTACKSRHKLITTYFPKVYITSNCARCYEEKLQNADTAGTGEQLQSPKEFRLLLRQNEDIEGF